MKNGDGVQVLPDYVLIRRENQMLMSKITGLNLEISNKARIIKKKNEYIDLLLKRLGR